MRLERDEFSFELLIVGYQFPELADADYDSNWLNVKIIVSIVVERSDRIKDSRLTTAWSALDPALLTSTLPRSSTQRSNIATSEGEDTHFIAEAFIAGLTASATGRKSILSFFLPCSR